MYDFDLDRFLDGAEELKKQFVEIHLKTKLLEAAVEAHDKWAVPDAETADDRYAYVPINIGDFVEWLIELDTYLRDDADFKHRLKKYRPFSFLEIGCGIGRNLNLVRNQEHLPVAKAVGFDSVKSYIDVARQLFGLGNDVFVQDCMTFDYSGFDVIYFYRPFSDDKSEVKFEKYLISRMKKGSIAIGASADFLDKSREMMPVGDSGRLFKRL